MQNLLNIALATMQGKQSTRMRNTLKNASQEPQTFIGTVSGFNSDTGTYTAITPDGGEVPVKLGNFGSPPSQVSIVATKGSTVQFADFKAPQ